MEELTPKRIVAELDKHIVGQKEAKKCVAIAVRNRWRRQQLPPDLRDDVAPKNIIMIGPTGVGKTEIARRLATLVSAPFLKVEATKYTEVGYVGRNVDTIVRDLVENAIALVRKEAMKGVEAQASKHAESRLLDALLARTRDGGDAAGDERETEGEGRVSARESLRLRLHLGELDGRMVELSVEERSLPMMQVISNAGLEDVGFDMPGMLGNLFPSKQTKKKLTVAEARRLLQREEGEKLIDKEKVTRDAIQRAENAGIVFLDEIDKIAGKEHTVGPDVSREGVQRDLLPIVEGCTVSTRYGPVRTDHVLFIAAGAFHMSKPADLIPELQGRFPIRVELSSLGREDFVRILSEPKSALTRQYQALLHTEGVDLEFAPEALEEMAAVAAHVNETQQNIGARRLSTVLERVLEDVSFEAPDLRGQRLVIDREYVRSRLKDILASEDLSRFIL
ncbi:MAG: ATP-dependent protease ATPase subunit HslU [Planctomycetes bacterium]|nr:ATP-dependent protease ATPase subunit HslU [Planctomycetota bacterium]